MSADLAFLVQVGARPWMRGFNPASPTVLAFDDGWLALAAAHQARGLVTEDGWDRLAAVLTSRC
ncbi:MAG: hypothetical protein AB2L07_09330 [Thermoanaerobaculaceae bacterium]